MKSTTPSKSARRTSRKRAGRVWGEVTTAFPGRKYVIPSDKQKMTLFSVNVVFSRAVKIWGGLAIIVYCEEN